MTYKEFEESFLKEVLNNKPEYIRKGQALFNYLYEVNPDIANEIRATAMDCFHNDRLIPKTLEHLKQIWDDNNKNSA